jgi:tRNA threonylcarbamoyl adenosine modification protein YeaZ
MIGLALHTSSPELGLALTDLDETRSQVWPLGRDLTTYLHVCLQDFVRPHDWSELGFIAVAKGPGGFTGTRIGVVVARTLAQQLSIPLFGVSSLAAIAQRQQSAAPADQPAHTAVSLRAQRGEVFGAIYQHHRPTVAVALAEKIYPQSDWEAQLKSWSTPYHLIEAEGGLADSVTGVLEIAAHQWQMGDRPDWQSVLPFYGQHPVHR